MVLDKSNSSHAIDNADDVPTIKNKLITVTYKKNTEC